VRRLFGLHTGAVKHCNKAGKDYPPALTSHGARVARRLQPVVRRPLPVQLALLVGVQLAAAKRAPALDEPGRPRAQLHRGADHGARDGRIPPWRQVQRGDALQQAAGAARQERAAAAGGRPGTVVRCTAIGVAHVGRRETWP
jgi:hypothetical protein